jgi:TatD DNase family protein
MSSSSSLAAPSDALSPEQPVVRYVDIGANLLDERYTDGIYYGKKRHEQDFDLVLERALEQGVTHIILTAGTLEESRNAVQMVETYRNKWEEKNESGDPPLSLGCTVGVHPTRCQQEFVDNLKDGQTADDVLNELTELLSHGLDRGYVVAIGEFGLDYDRLEFAPKDVQLEFFRRQLQKYLSGDDHPGLCGLPLFLHNRSVGKDLLDILLEHNKDDRVPIKGVVHSFDDSLELALAFIDFGLYIGLNGCSLKTEENLEVVKGLPLDKILLETDCPYCEIKATHAGHKHIQTTFAGMKKADKKFETGKLVKGRNEPCQIVQVAEVIAGVKGIPVEEVARVCYQNSMELYGGFSTTKNPATIH